MVVVIITSCVIKTIMYDDTGFIRAMTYDVMSTNLF